MKTLNKIINSRKCIVFLDLEGTQFSHEMIGLGCVKVSLKKDLTIKKIHQGYQTLVKAKNPVGKIVTKLTGITDKQIKENGISFRNAIQELKKYLGKEFSKTLFVTYGNHDVRILQQSMNYNMDAPVDDVRLMIKHHFDFGEFISRYVRGENNNTYSLSNILKLFNVEFKGEAHDALADAINLAYLYQAMLKNKDILQKEYIHVLKCNNHLPEPLHKIVTDLADDKTVTPQQFNDMIKDFFN